MAESKSNELEPPDLHYASAVAGWLELGNVHEAKTEFSKIALEHLEHPEVVDLEWRIAAAERQWLSAVNIARRQLHAHSDAPSGWVNLSYSLHELGRTREAWENLVLAAKKFSDVAIIPYNLACYACQLGCPEESLEWLQRAFAIEGKKELKLMALDDPDLEPLRDKIRLL